MRVKLFAITVIALLLSVAMACQSTAPEKNVPESAATQSTCDRACLEGYVDKYMDAMLAHDPNKTLFAENCKFTENGVQLPLGNEGLWASMVGEGNI